MFVLFRFLILAVVLFQVAQTCGVGDEGDDNLKKSLGKPIAFIFCIISVHSVTLFNFFLLNLNVITTDDYSFSEEIEERKLNWKKPNTHSK